MTSSRNRRPWLSPLLGCFAVFGVAAAMMSYLFLVEWGDVDDALTLLGWSSSEEKLLRVDYPRWFVRLKTAASFNLGTMISVARGDWGHLDLSVTFDDLRRRGPGLLLDHRIENGSRILLWTSTKDGESEGVWEQRQRSLTPATYRSPRRTSLPPGRCRAWC